MELHIVMAAIADLDTFRNALTGDCEVTAALDALGWENDAKIKEAMTVTLDWLNTVGAAVLKYKSELLRADSEPEDGVHEYTVDNLTTLYGLVTNTAGFVQTVIMLHVCRPSAASGLARVSDRRLAAARWKSHPLRKD